jgi:hypothetical protein
MSREGKYIDSTVPQSFTGRPRSKFRKKIRRTPTVTEDQGGTFMFRSSRDGRAGTT